MAETKEGAVDLAALRAQMQLDRAKLTDSILAKFTASSSSTNNGGSSSSSSSANAKGNKGKAKANGIESEAALGTGVTANGGRKYRPATLGLGAEMKPEEEQRRNGGAAPATREDRRLLGMLKGKKRASDQDSAAIARGQGSRPGAMEVEEEEEEAGRAAEVEAAANKKRKQSILDPFAAGNKKKRKEQETPKASPVINGNGNGNGEDGLSKAQRKKLNKKRRLEEEQQQQQQPKDVAEAEDEQAKEDVTPSPEKIEEASKPATPSVIAQEPALTDHQQSLLSQLSGSRFRQINETLYTSPSADALRLIQAEPSKLLEYHEGFRKQTKSWPEIPVEKIAKMLRERKEPLLVVDLGAGEAILAKLLRGSSSSSNAKKGGKSENGHSPIKVLSYDLLDSQDGWVKGIDIAQAGGLPLPGIVGETNSARAKHASSGSIHHDPAVADVAVFCLSLMGTNWVEMIIEARRVLRSGKGSLIIAEVVSRFTNVDEFIKLIELLGFQLTSKDLKNTHFSLFEFRKLSDKELSSPSKALSAMIKDDQTERKETNALVQKGQTILKPCLYKRR